jgi:histidyl-tRNA synthetase
MGKVWRYENPQAGRYREFVQADVDIIGSDSMACEAELIAIFNMVCQKLNLKDHKIICNHRKILIADLQRLEMPDDKHSDILRTLDKLHKIGEQGVINELTGKGYAKERSKEILLYLNDQKMISRKSINEPAVFHWPWEMEHRKSDLEESEVGKEGLTQLKEMYDLAIAAGVPKDCLRYDPTLVRGLDYYTGPVFEFQTLEKTGVGSFGGGGRYDNLVEAFGGPPKPAVGFAFGVDRLVHVYLAQNPESAAMPPADVYVFSEGINLVNHAIEMAAKCREVGVKTLVALEPRKKKKEFKFAVNEGLPFTIFITKPDWDKGKAQLKKIEQDTESQYETLLLQEIINRLIKWVAEKQHL